MKKNNLLVSLVALVAIVGCNNNGDSSTTSSVNQMSSSVIENNSSSSSSSERKMKTEAEMFLEVKTAVNGFEINDEFYFKKVRSESRNIKEDNGELGIIEEDIKYRDEYELTYDLNKNIYSFINITNIKEDGELTEYEYFVKQFVENNKYYALYQHSDMFEEFGYISKETNEYYETFDAYHANDELKHFISNYGLNFENVGHIFKADSIKEIEDAYASVYDNFVVNEVLSIDNDISVNELDDGSVEFVVTQEINYVDRNENEVLCEEKTFEQIKYIVKDSQLVSFTMDSKVENKTFNNKNVVYHYQMESSDDIIIDYDFNDNFYNSFEVELPGMHRISQSDEYRKHLIIDVYGYEFDTILYTSNYSQPIESAFKYAVEEIEYDNEIDIKDDKLYYDKEMTKPIDISNLTKEEYFSIDRVYADIAFEENQSFMYEIKEYEYDLSESFDLVTIKNMGSQKEFVGYIASGESTLTSDNVYEYETVKTYVNGEEKEYGSTYNFEVNTVYVVEHKVQYSDYEIGVADMFFTFRGLNIMK